MSYAKEKGKELEDHVADLIVSKGIDPRARRDGASGAGNREKGDIQTSMMILNQNAGIECKNWNTICIPEWWKQTKKLESLGREPMLVYKIRGTSYDDSLCTMYLDTVLELIKASNTSPKPQNQVIGGENTENNRELKYALEQLKVALNKVIKLI